MVTKRHRSGRRKEKERQGETGSRLPHSMNCDFNQIFTHVEHTKFCIEKTRNFLVCILYFCILYYGNISHVISLSIDDKNAKYKRRMHTCQQKCGTKFIVFDYIFSGYLHKKKSQENSARQRQKEIARKCNNICKKINEDVTLCQLFLFIHFLCWPIIAFSFSFTFSSLLFNID